MAESKGVRILNSQHANNAPQQTTAVELSQKLQKCMLRLKGEFMSDDGKGVDYSKMKGSNLFSEYKEQAVLLQNVDLGTLNEQEKKAFFINAYNTLTIHGLAEETQTPSSVLTIQQFWKNTGYNIGSHVFSLDDIEHGILRGNRPHPASTQPQLGIKDPRLKFVVQKLDPRIHFALVCGAKSCPAIQVYSAQNLDSALDAAARNFCASEVSMFTEVDQVWLSRIFQWYRADFGETDVEVINWTIPYLEKNIQERAQILLFKIQEVGKVDIKYNEYDWNLNKT